MTFLIISHHSDVHALAVQCALLNRGKRSRYLCMDAYPFVCAHSLKVSNSGSNSDIGGLTEANLESVDSIWFRRRAITRIFDYCEPWSDEDFRRRTIAAYAYGLYEWLAENNRDAIWVNHPHAAARANSKALQLQLARDNGFQIPDTLISNDPGEIRKFFSGRESTVVKSFIPFGWRKEDDGRIVALTSEIPCDFEIENESLRLQPAIYQDKIKKAFEVRYTIFGDYEFAIRIDSQRRKETHLDWRAAPPKHEEVSPIILPDSIRYRCRGLMQSLGISFGCFDLINNEEGEYIFLEVNEAGQFLWIEDLLPEYQILDAFSAFICRESFACWRPRDENRFSVVQRSPVYQEMCAEQREIRNAIGEMSPVSAPV